MKKLLFLFMLIITSLMLTSCTTKNDDEDTRKVSSNRDEDEDEDEDDDDEDEDDVDSKEDKKDKENDRDKKNKDDEEDDDDDILTSGNTTSISKGDYTDFRTALSTFISDYTTLKDPHFDIIQEDSDYGDYSLDILGILMVDLGLIEVPLYDSIDIMSNGPKVTGKMMLTEAEGTKELDGDKIRFYSEYVQEEEFGSGQKGDIHKSNGYLDTKKNFLLYEVTTQSGKEVVSRTVYEFIRLKNDTIIMQYFTFDSRGLGDTGSTIVFVISPDEMTVATGKIAGTIEFSYTSLTDVKEAPADEILQGDLKFAIRVANGDAKFEKIN